MEKELMQLIYKKRNKYFIKHEFEPKWIIVSPEMSRNIKLTETFSNQQCDPIHKIQGLVIATVGFAKADYMEVAG